MKRTKIIFHSRIGALIEYEEIYFEMITLSKTIQYTAKLLIDIHI